MAIALYNPKFVVSGGKKVQNSADVKRFVWSHAYWDLKVNEMKKFPDEVGHALLRQCEFLVEVTPKNLKEVKDQMAEKKFQCPDCVFATDTKIALFGHMKGVHGATEEQNKEFSEVGEAEPTGTFHGPTGRKGRPTPEEQSGVPSTAEGSVKDSDGVVWYDKGEERDELN